MRNKENWAPSKFRHVNGRMIGSRDTRDVGLGSRLMTDLIARCYDDHIKQHASGKLIDLGCGRVPLYAAYKDYVVDNICVDWENTTHKNDYLDYECDLSRELPFGDGEFDTILFSDVLEHIPDPERVWREMSRILAPNGKLLLNVPFYYWIHEEPHDYYRYTQYALKRFVERSGLQLVLIQPIGGAPEVLADIMAKNVLRLPAVGGKLAVFIQWLTRRFIDTRFGRAVSESTGQNFPFGYFLVAQKPAAAS